MLKARPRILIADDDAAMRELLEDILSDEGYDTRLAFDGKGALAALLHESCEVVVTDFRMPGASGMDVVRAAQRLPSPPPVILLTAFGSIEGAVEAIQAGAFDYLTKPLPSPRALREVVKRAIASRAPQEAKPSLHNSAAIYADPASVRLLELIQRVAARDTTVLLLGESGVGKEIASREIHRSSARADGPFVAINCGAIPEELFESQLFGHVKGSFTGANQDHRGYFEQAQGGTLLLDEVAELSANAQVKLLRVLEERCITRVGDTRSRPIDVRVLAATHRNLPERVQQGDFRQDLYYRLSVFPLTIPPLRERPGDILPLALGCLDQLGEGHHSLSIEVRATLVGYAWPGNARELRNVIERAVILAGNHPIRPEDLNLHGDSSLSPPPANPDPEAPMDLKMLERQAIQDALQSEGGNRRRAAERLGIALRTLQYKLKEYGLIQR